MKKFSPSTGWFYSEETHGENIPSDAVDISDEVYESLKTYQSEGKQIVSDDEGYPTAIDRPVTNTLRKYTPLEFLDMFTADEQIAVVEATMSIASVKLWYDKMLASSFIDLEDPRTPAGLTALVSAGLITQSRYDEIMGLAD